MRVFARYLDQHGKARMTNYSEKMNLPESSNRDTMITIAGVFILFISITSFLFTVIGRARAIAEHHECAVGDRSLLGTRKVVTHSSRA
jgi:hypothetical protein